MFPLYIFALLIHTAFSITPCQDGVEIVTQETKNPIDLIGNWTFVYHWDTKNKFPQEFIDKSKLSKGCPVLQISAVSSDFIKTKEAECANSKVPFNWADVKLRVDAPAMKINGGIISISQKENWMTVDCTKSVRVELSKISDDYIVMTAPDVDNISEMIARNTPTLEELKCIAHNVDISNGMKGFGLCYQI